MVRKCVEIKTNAVFAAKIMRKRRVARGVATADIGKNLADTAINNVNNLKYENSQFLLIILWLFFSI